MSQIIQIVLEHLLWDLSHSNRDLLNRLAIRRLFRDTLADSAPKKVLTTENNQRGVIDRIDLLPHHHHAHATCHPHRDIVDQQGHSLTHLNYLLSTKPQNVI